MQKREIIIIGTGAAGLMAARELSKAGKKVIILEGRDRIGGRIMPLSEIDFGYPAQGGAEFVHGEAPITKSLISEANLTYIAEAGEVWSARGGTLKTQTGFVQHDPLLDEKLKELEEDMPISDFLDKYFGDEEHADFRNSLIKMVEGYDAADSHLASTLSLRNEWFGKNYGEDGWIKEGYGALINFLDSECRKNGVDILLNSVVTSIEYSPGRVLVATNKGEKYECNKVIVTVTLPTLNNISFEPALPEKIESASKIGFGPAIKLLIKFRSQWWKTISSINLGQLSFLLSGEDFTAWWTQYPIEASVLTGWMAGPAAEKNKNLTDEELFELGLSSLSTMFKIEKNTLERDVVVYKVVNWGTDPFALGAYSYTTTKTKDAYKKFREPVTSTVYFAGEALCEGFETATVEGALASGKETAEKILGF